MTKQDHDRVIKLEEQFCSISDKVDEIINNHLVHISADIKELQTSVSSINLKLAMWSGGIVVMVWFLERYVK